jgi:hypothetical protein
MVFPEWLIAGLEVGEIELVHTTAPLRVDAAKACVFHR